LNNGGEHVNNEKCPDCQAVIAVPEDAVQGEIVSCPDCGLDLEVTKTGESFAIKALVVEKEDWGE
jgi:alpha-aminoadipate/glutamate carrier protein LysW